MDANAKALEVADAILRRHLDDHTIQKLPLDLVVGLRCDIAAALEEAGQCPHCDAQNKELLERREVEIKRLQDALEEAGRDRERLDWWESECRSVEFFPAIMGSPDVWVVEDGWRGTTVREAVDAAMKGAGDE